MQRLLPYFTLFTSFGTLICCALPALFVSIGLGAAVVATISTVPQLVWISERKGLVFLVAGSLLILSGGLRYASRNLACPIEPDLRDACVKGQRISKLIFWLSVGLYLTGGIFAYGLPLIMN